MKHVFRQSLAVLIFCCLTFTLYAQQIPGYTMVWNDEFSGSGAPDPAKWSHAVVGPGWVNNELQNYTNRTENSRQENGHLIIECRRDWYGGHEYSSARIFSQGNGDWTYGRMEASIKVPSGLGTWPAFWMMPTNPYLYATTCDETTGSDADCDAWPNSGEIDILERVGYE
ncbi:MAG TPA: glycoside hydrolase, partial [Cytophagales bacterium]|nr:glycoside hydrolase [Cytophagales bacterium]